MRDMKAGDYVRTLPDITIIVGLRKLTIPRGTCGRIESCVASNAGFVRLAEYGTMFVTAEDVEPDIESEKDPNEN